MIPSPSPRRPTHLSPLAERCLVALAERGFGRRVSIGGAVGLLHFHDYRATADLDAWWQRDATTAERLEVEDVVSGVLAAAGDVQTRRWGDVVSIELLQDGKKTFSFQIADRSAQLEPSIAVPWIDVAMDSWNDLVASKMVALVERGAPRDFRDVFAICQAGLADPAVCWRLWRERQRLADRDAGSDRARVAVETHLARLDRARPLSGIADVEDRRNAESVRAWLGKELLGALVD